MIIHQLLLKNVKNWKEDFISKNSNADDKQVNKAWLEHYKEISKRSGEWVTIEN